MSSVIHMEVEVVEEAISVFKAVVEQGEGLQLHRLAETLHVAWQGPSGEAFADELRVLARNYSQLFIELNELTQRLQREKEEWLEVDRRFGERALNTDVTTNVAKPARLITPEWVHKLCEGRKDRKLCETVWKGQPQDAWELAYMIQSLPESSPIGIFNLGNGEVLVLLKGTVDSPIRGNNWWSAFRSFFTHENSYQSSVITALTKAKNDGLIPPNAKLHIAGHSQGGMVAQNLAVDPRLAKLGVSVETVTTFGSPDTFSPPNPHTKYIMFENKNDPIAHLDQYAMQVKEAPNQVNVSLETGSVKVDMTFQSEALKDLQERIPAPASLHDVKDIAERHIINTPGDAISAHDYQRIEAAAELRQCHLPFSSSGSSRASWGSHTFAQSNAGSIQNVAGGVIGAGIKYHLQEAATVVKVAKEAKDLVEGVAEEAANMVGLVD